MCSAGNSWRKHSNQKMHTYTKILRSRYCGQSTTADTSRNYWKHHRIHLDKCIDHTSRKRTIFIVSGNREVWNLFMLDNPIGYNLALANKQAFLTREKIKTAFHLMCREPIHSHYWSSTKYFSTKTAKLNAIYMRLCYVLFKIITFIPTQ